MRAQWHSTGKLKEPQKRVTLISLVPFSVSYTHLSWTILQLSATRTLNLLSSTSTAHSTGFIITYSQLQHFKFWISWIDCIPSLNVVYTAYQKKKNLLFILLFPSEGFHRECQVLLFSVQKFDRPTTNCSKVGSSSAPFQYENLTD